MAVLEILELDDNTLDVDDTGNRTLVRSFFVRCETGDRATVALLGVPIARYDSHPDEPDCVAKTAKVKRVGLPHEWRALG